MISKIKDYTYFANTLGLIQPAHDSQNIDYNKLNFFDLDELTDNEKNLWLMLMKNANNESNHVSISRDTLIRDYGISYKMSLRSAFDNTATHLIKLNQCYDTEKVSIIFVLFPAIEIFDDSVTIEVSKEILPWLRYIQKTFSQMDIDVINKLNTKYIRDLYKYLAINRKKWISSELSDKFKMTYSELKSFLFLDRAYNAKQVMSDILSPMERELSNMVINGNKIFSDFKIDTTLTPAGKSIKEIKFTFLQNYIFQN